MTCFDILLRVVQIHTQTFGIIIKVFVSALTIESFWDVFMQLSVSYKTKLIWTSVTKTYLSLNSDSKIAYLHGQWKLRVNVPFRFFGALVSWPPLPTTVRKIMFCFMLEIFLLIFWKDFPLFHCYTTTNISLSFGKNEKCW